MLKQKEKQEKKEQNKNADFKSLHDNRAHKIIEIFEQKKRESIG